MPGFPCGNNPRQQLTPGDAQAIDEFRTFLEERAQDGTVPSVDRARAALQRFASVPGFVDAIERFEAAVRANERSGETRAAALREASEVAVRNARGCGPSEAGQHAAAVAAGIGKVLRGMADEAQP